MSLTAADIMTKTVLTAKPDDTVAAVAKLLSEHDISAVPVCDANGAVIGMVSESDLLTPVGTESTARRSRWLTLLAEGTDFAADFVEYIGMGNRRIGDLMVKPVITAAPDTGVPQLADLLVRHHVKRLPIVQDGRLVGLVSRADLIRAFARDPDAVVEPP
ncbi:MAG: CBS domain-containing protein [Rhodopila sp.]|jgi:CBS domain-containing protein